MRLLARSALAVAVAAATAGAGYSVTGVARADDTSVLGPGLVTVDVGIHYSRFSIDTLHVRAGTTVRFVVHNDDPIDHEFVVGDDAVHAHHEQGTETVHPPVPGEVSVAPDETGETFSRFDRPGRLLFACHLPGHFAYGMRGTVVVEP